MNELQEIHIVEQTRAILGQKYRFHNSTLVNLITDFKGMVAHSDNINSFEFLNTLHAHIFNQIKPDIAQKKRSKNQHKFDLDLKNFAYSNYKRINREIGHLNKNHQFSFIMTPYAIAQYHNKFIRIHPFVEGNLLIAKLMMMGQCMQNGYNYPIFYDRNNKDLYRKGLLNVKYMEQLILKCQYNAK